MEPYPGESLAVFKAADGADFSLVEGVIYRGGFFSTSPTSATLASGDAWRAWVAPGSADYLGAATDLTVSWVLEVLSGTVTFTAGEAYDPAFGNAALAPASSLGTYTVTGPATVVIPSGITGAQVYDHPDSFMLHLSATSGSAVVQQVKLRVWPGADPVGGWSDLQPSFDTDPINAGVRYAGQQFTGTGVSTDAEASWDAAVADFSADVGANSGATSRPFGSVAPPSPSAAQGMILSDLGEYTTTVALNAVQVMLLGADASTAYPIGPGLVEGVDWIRPPEEVHGDTAHYAQQVGSPSVGWLNAVVTLTNIITNGMPGLSTVAAAAGDHPDLDPGTDFAFAVAYDHSSEQSGAINLPTAGARIAVALSHSMGNGVADDYPGWTPSVLVPLSRDDGIGYVLGSGGDPVQTYVTLPPYRVWTPDGVAEIATKVRQLHRDERGMTPRRHFGGASRATTGRHFGYD